MGNMRIRAVEEYDWGLYVWLCPSGRYFGDTDGNTLSIPARKGDVEKIKQLVDAARYWGAPEQGRPHFLPGQRQITDEEFEEQVMRAKWGLVPDPLDIGAIKDEIRGKKNGG